MELVHHAVGCMPALELARDRRLEASCSAQIDDNGIGLLQLLERPGSCGVGLPQGWHRPP